MKTIGKTRKIVAAACAVLLEAALIVYLVLDGKGSSVTVTWFSCDDEKLCTITLNSDGTFSAISKYGTENTGKYTKDQYIISMKDQYGFDSGKLQISNDESGKTISINDGKAAAYFRTSEEADADKEQRALLEKENKIMYISSAKQIMMKGEWTDEDSAGLRTLFLMKILSQ